MPAAALVLLLCAAAGGPVLELLSPRGAPPGKTVEVTLRGSGMEEPLSLWTGFPSQAVLSARGEEGREIVATLSVPSSVAPGVGAVRLVTGSGLSDLKLFLIDDLPAIPQRAGGLSPRSAQEVVVPLAVDAAASERQLDYYAFTALAGQEISLEVVARRIGSRLDPVVRLLGPDGHEAAYLDDVPGLEGDVQLARRLEAAGRYVIEVRDVEYRGGSEYFYRLRLGGRPLRRDVLFPAAPPASSASASAPAPLEEVESHTAPGPGGLREEDRPITIPASIRGAFQRPGDVDGFRLAAARAGERIVVRGFTRSRGSPCDLYLAIEKPGGVRLAQADPAGADEGVLDCTFPAPGEYRLVVEELNRRGGSALCYWLEVEPYRPGFSLELATEKVSAPPRGTFAIPITCARRGYDGPIALELAGAGEGFRLEEASIPAGKKEATLKVSVPADLHAGQVILFAVAGRAKLAGGEEISARASTLPAVRKLFPAMLYPPPALDGVVTLGIAALPAP